MSFFGLFQDKKKAVSLKQSTLVAIDWDSLQNESSINTILNKVENPHLWIYTRSATEPRGLDKLDFNRIEVKNLPQYEKSIALYIAYSIFYALGCEHNFNRLIIISGNPALKGLVEFAKDHQIISAEIISFEGSARVSSRSVGTQLREPRESINRKENLRRNDRQDLDASLNKNGKAVRTDHSEQRRQKIPSLTPPSVPTRTVPIRHEQSTLIRPDNKQLEPNRKAHPKTNREQSISETPHKDERKNIITTSAPENSTESPKKQRQRLSTSSEDALKIADYIKQHYTLGEVYKKSVFGMLLKKATGKTVIELFNSKNAAPFINVLVKKGCLEKLDSENFKLVSFPEPALIMSIPIQTPQ